MPEKKKTLTPDRISRDASYDSFDDGKVVFGKKKGHLPAMGWNSWNAFGSGNNEKLTRTMADLICKLGLKDLGYEFVVLDDGCYKPERVDGRLANENVKFPSGFSKLSDYIHKKGLKFGMYNDIGTNLCAGAAVGTCGHEREDAESYLGWGVDFLKVDNCYYPFDNATFSLYENARFTFAPNIRSIKVDGKKLIAAKDGMLAGKGAKRVNISRKDKKTGKKINDRHVTRIGTFDGTGCRYSPVGEMSGELVFEVKSSADRSAAIEIEYATGRRERVGEWLQLAVENEMFYDDLLPATTSENDYVFSDPIKIKLKKGINRIRIMNHRRQENTLNSYARLLKWLNKLAPDNDIIYSACEWGKTQPQNWAYKVCDSWRILNDITFRVGSDGDPGYGSWESDYTCSVTSQYNKAVIMDSFAGLDKGWNDPDMLMIGMKGLNLTQNKTHMAMWCMMNAPLMLGLDLRRVKKGDALHKIIANKDLISIDQDPLGVQAKRIYCSLAASKPDRTYVRDIDRVDILAKPMTDGKAAISFINVSGTDKKDGWKIFIKDIARIFKKYGLTPGEFEISDVWSGKVRKIKNGVIEVNSLKAYENKTYILTPVKNR